MRKLVDKVEEHLKQGGQLKDLYSEDVVEVPPHIPRSDNGLAVAKSSANPTLGPGSSQPKPAKKRTREYRPQFRSGGYAIMMALYERMLEADQPGAVISGSTVQMTKAQIIEKAQPYCDKSFTIAATMNYTAWSSISTLTDKELVYKQGNPARFSLTEQGVEVAKELWEKTCALEGMPAEVPKANNAAQSGRNQIQPTPAVSAAASSQPANRASPSQAPFMFRYVSFEGEDVEDRDEALVHIENQELLYKIKYHEKQSSHGMLVHVKKLTIVPDGDGHLFGLMRATHAPRLCPGINKNVLRGLFSVGNVDLSKQPILNSQSTASTSRFQTADKAHQKRRSSITASKVSVSSSEHAVKPIPPQMMKPPSVDSLGMKRSRIETSTFASSAQSSSSKPLVEKLKEKFAVKKAETVANTLTLPAPQGLFWPEPSPPEPLQITWLGPPIRFPAGSFDICLVLDNRELRSVNDRTYIVDRLQERGVTCFVRPLELGDVAWVARPRQKTPNGEFHEATLDALLERKRLDDLASSIKDGRFKEQKNRLRRCGLSRIWYLVEDYSGIQVDEVGKLSLRTAMVETQLLDNICVHRTENLDKTIQFLVSLHGTVSKLYSKEDLYVLPPGLVDRNNFVQFRNQVNQRDRRKYHFTQQEFGLLNSKSKTMSLRDVWFKQLMCIRGLSADKASNIIERCPTADQFFRTMEALPDDEARVKFLRDKDGAIQSKNIGPQLAKRIVELFCSPAYTDHLQ